MKFGMYWYDCHALTKIGAMLHSFVNFSCVYVGATKTKKLMPPKTLAVWIIKTRSVTFNKFWKDTASLIFIWLIQLYVDEPQR